MATTEQDYTTRSGPDVLAHVADVWIQRGRTVRVDVKQGPHGPAIDVREWIDADAYTAEDRRVMVGSSRKPRRNTRSTYTGPTRKGLWLSLDAAEVLSEAIASALIVAGSMADADGMS